MTVIRVRIWLIIITNQSNIHMASVLSMYPGISLFDKTLTLKSCDSYLNVNMNESLVYFITQKHEPEHKKCDKPIGTGVQEGTCIQAYIYMYMQRLVAHYLVTAKS